MATFDHFICRKNRKMKLDVSVLEILKWWGTSQIFRRGSKK